MSAFPTPPYAPRRFTSHAIADLGGARVKPYAIEARGREAGPIERALACARGGFAASPLRAMPHCGLGYVIHHAGEDADWLLTRLWVPGGSVAGLLARIVDAEAVLVTEPLIACVWEEVVIHHERDAWVRCGMSPDNAEAYLADRLVDGFH